MILAVVMIVLLLVKAGAYSGVFATVMLAMTISMQNVMSIASDEKTNWKKYQLSLPVSNMGVVASKYIVVLCTLLLSLLGSIVFSLVSGAIYANFDIAVLAVSALIAIIIPLVWTGICLPLTYWFGFRSAQTMGMIVVVPIFLLVKQFEDGSGISVLPATLSYYITFACIVSVTIFILSFVISLFGYIKKQ